MTIRNATANDIETITKIYNWAVVNTTATFDLDIKTIDDMKIWFQTHEQRHPVIVYENQEEVLAWGSINKWSNKRAYDSTGEVSFYVDPNQHGQGIGTKLLVELIKISKTLDYLTLLSRITQESESSIHIHEKLGFRTIGTMQQAGIKFDRVIDVCFMQFLIKK